MKRYFLFSVVLLLFFLFTLSFIVSAQEKNEDNSIFKTSLHHTVNGMAYWYAQENGGLEKITAIPYFELDCQNCHVKCDQCHLAEKEGIKVYDTEKSLQTETCLVCHSREKSMMKIDKEANQMDVHIAAGLKCMDCHSAREIHGDGTKYLSMKQPGAMDTKCEKCHEELSENVSHSVHGEKVDCKACHERHVLSCTNCHMQTLIKEGKRVAIPTSDWIFLMNYENKVTSANMQTFVVPENKTFLMFAPQHTHSVMDKGRQCNECHATEIVKQLQKGELALSWSVDNSLKYLKGVVPVIEGIKWGIFFQDFLEQKWVPLKDPLDPVIHYAGFGTPLTKEQLDKLAQPQSK
jgi:hypothetical protein